MNVQEVIVEHYSIQAVDIFIQEIASKKGWHLGDIIYYQVKNCAWESRIELQLKAKLYGAYELQGKQVFQSGDQEKMLKDQDITLLALQAYISRHQQNKQPVKWV